MKTTPRVSFGLYAIDIKQDSTPSTASDLQPFSKIGDLKTDNVASNPYATYEPNFWLLSGNYKILPVSTTSVHVGFMSLEQSGSDSLFLVAPVLTVTFTIPHTSDGLTLRFSTGTGDYCSSLVVDFYDGADQLISNTEYHPTETEFTISETVEGFQKIVITFLETSVPYRYLRLIGIDFGQLLRFEGSTIKSASIIEEVDVLSTELRVNTFNLRLYSEDADFSIMNPTGYYAALKARQPLAVYELVDTTPYFMGQFYLNDWKNPTESEIEFDCVDLVGVLNDIDYRGGIYTGSGITVQTLLANMLEAIYIPYDLDADLYDIMVIGWIPYTSYREALQQIAYAIGAQVDTSRSWGIKIYSTKIADDEIISGTITRAQKAQNGQSVTLKKIVTGVAITSHDYVESTEEKELYNGTLAVGDYEIKFSEPMHDLGISGGTITSSGANYAIINVSSPGVVVLTGEAYIDTKKVIPINTTGLSTTIRANIWQVNDATLVHSGNVDKVAQRTYDYSQQRYKQEVRLFAPMEQTGDVVDVETLSNRKIKGVIERMDIDLTGGYVVKTSIVGVDNGVG
jgi:hypothetical protein